MPNKLILPGLIDLHCHLRGLGQNQKEDFTTGTMAAIAGGFTKIFDMPNNLIPITTNNLLEQKVKEAKNKVLCDIGFYFGSMGNNDNEFNKAKKNIFGMKLYLNKTTGNFIINQDTFKWVVQNFPKNLPILIHAEEDILDDIISVIIKAPRKIHVCHVSNKKELKSIINAKEKKLPITCGVTPHHLYLTRRATKKIGALGTMKPPLGDANDVEFLWKNIKYIDCIETDHAPHTMEEKLGNSPPFGVPGLETALPLILTSVIENKISIDEVKRLFVEGPSKILGLPLKPDSEIEIDVSKKYIIKGKSLFTKCKWTPFEGKKVKGRVTKVTIRKKKVYEDGKFFVNSGFGNILRPINP